MRFFAFIIFVLINSNCLSQNGKIYTLNEVDEPPILNNHVVQKELDPKEDFQKSVVYFVQRNTSIITAKKSSSEKAYVEILIDEKGNYSITNSRGSIKKAQKEAIKGVKKIPGFTPAKINGNPVKMKMVIPVTFNIIVI